MASHDVVFVIYKVVVKVNVMWPQLSVVWEADLGSVVDVVSDGAVVNCITVRGVERAFRVEDPVD